MTTLVPAIRSKMGSRDYYIAKMRASALAGEVAIASELDDWENLTLDDVYQRDLNRKRVEQEIAPYLANTEDRFFGSIIILIRDPNAIVFESVLNFSDNMLAAYRNTGTDLGFLTIDSSPNSQYGALVALDGQHRVAALRHVVQGNAVGPCRDAVSNDEVAVIFISDSDLHKARELFTMLNKSARKVSRNDVLVMSESDPAAIVARRLTVTNLLNPRNLEDHPLVKWESNTIKLRDTQITTLNALYELARIVMEFQKLGNIDDQDELDEDGRPPESDIQSIFETCKEWLGSLFDECQDFADMRSDTNLIVDSRRNDRPFSLLLRPVGFILFFEAVAKCMNPAIGKFEDITEVMRRLLQVDWSLESVLWRGIMVNARGNISNKAVDRNLASDLAVWLVAGDALPVGFKQGLIERFRKQYNRADASLPIPLEF
jgi:DNA sulfur modification protein DndB